MSLSLIKVNNKNVIGVDEKVYKNSNNLIESNAVYKEVVKKPDIGYDDKSDLSFCDSNNRVIAQFSNGHIKTKNFDSETDILNFEDDKVTDFSISDSSGRVIADFKDGHIKTKNFDSSKINPTPTSINLLNSQFFSPESTNNFSGWSNSGFTLSSNKATSSTAGAILVSPLQFCHDKREFCLVFEATQNTVLVLGSVNGTYGSTIEFNMSDNTVSFLKPSNGSKTQRVEEIPAQISEPNYYRLTVGVNGRNPYFKVEKHSQNYVSYWEEVVSKEHVTQILGYRVARLTWGYEAGTLIGQAFILLSSGSVTIHKFTHTVKHYPTPYIYVIGDSITHGFGVAENQRYTSLLKDAYGAESIGISGIGGATTASSVSRIVSELNFIKPINATIFLGTNGETVNVWNTNMQTIVNKLKTVGSNIYVLTIPSNGTLSRNAITFSSENQIEIIDIASILSNNYSVIQDYYECQDYEGTTYSDGIHPNGLGHSLIAEAIINKIK